PASGNHYNATGQGPIRGGFYDQNTAQVPEGWVHNLEHGALVLAYKCPGPGCTDEGQSAMQALLGRWPNSPICKIPPGNFTPLFTPEKQCTYPSPTPGPATPSPVPSGSPTGAPSGAASPGASTAASPAGS